MSTENLAQKIHYQFETLKRYDDNISSSNVNTCFLLATALPSLSEVSSHKFLMFFGNMATHLRGAESYIADNFFL